MYICEECDKQYIKYNSYWKHRKDKHMNNTVELFNNDKPIIEYLNDKPDCQYCSKTYSNKFSLTRHVNNCKLNPQNMSIEQQKALTKLDDNTIVNLLKTMKDNDIKNAVVGNKNNVANNIARDQINIDNTINNNTQNIFNIVTLGKENLSDVLDDNEQVKILNQRFNCFDYMVDYIHLNKKYPQFHNMIINDLKSNKGLIYNDIKKDFDVVKKENMLDTLIENRLNDIEDFLIKNSNKVKKTTRLIIEKFIKNITEEFDNKNSKYMKDKKDDIQVMMYNKRDVVKKTHNITS